MTRVITARGFKTALSPMTADDQPFFLQWLLSTPDLRTMIDDTGTPTAEGQQAWFLRSQEPDRSILSILADSDTLIGNGGFVDIDPSARTAQFRITIGNHDYWGKGYGRDATRLLLRYGLDHLPIDTVWLRVRNHNERAKRLYDSLGFTVDKMENDSHYMSLTRAAFDTLPTT